MALREIGARLTLDGEKEFNSQMAACNSELKNLGSEMAVVTSEYADNAKSTKALKAQNEVLTKQIEQTKVKQEALAQAARDAAQALLDESAKQVPHDTGALELSGTVSSEPGHAVVSYDTPYAVRWHETPANFQRGRKMKYLEDPANDAAVHQQMLDALARGLKF